MNYLDEKLDRKYMANSRRPCIVLITDGDTTDNYQSALNNLLKNSWFKTSDRIIVLANAINSNTWSHELLAFVDSTPDRVMDIIGMTSIPYQYNDGYDLHERNEEKVNFPV